MKKDIDESNQNIRKVSFDKVMKKHLSCLKIDKTVFLVGAGISLSAPTGLPSGQALTDYYLDISIGKNNAEKLRNLWSEINSIIASDHRFGNQFDFPMLRLEFIIGNINKVDREFKRTPLVNGISQFSHALCNSGHECLAKILDCGGIIVTPNFDRAIEAAIGGTFTFDDAIGFPVLSNGGKKLYYFHGIANDDNNQMQYNLGATIEKIKEGLPKKFQEVLKEWFSRGYSLVMLGYSVSDFFDIVPFFQHLEQGEYESTCIFMNHNGPVKRSEYNRIKKCFMSFKNSVIIEGSQSTQDFLELLTRGKASHTASNTRKNADWWQCEFKKILQQYGDEKSELRKDFQAVNTVRICDQIGLNIENVMDDAYEIVHRCVEQELDSGRDLVKDLINLPDKEVTIIPALKRIHSKQYLKMLRRKHKVKCGECEEQKKAGKRNCKKCRELYEILKVDIDEGYKNWHDPVAPSLKMKLSDLSNQVNDLTPDGAPCNSALVYAANRLTKEFLHDWKRRKSKQGDLEEIFEDIQKMLELSYNQYMYISYYITLLKLKNLLLAVREPENENIGIEAQILEMALEICSIEDIIKAYVNFSRKTFYRFKAIRGKSLFETIKKKYQFITTNKCQYVREAGQNILLAMKLSKAIGKPLWRFT